MKRFIRTHPVVLAIKDPSAIRPVGWPTVTYSTALRCYRMYAAADVAVAVLPRKIIVEVLNSSRDGPVVYDVDDGWDGKFESYEDVEYGWAITKCLPEIVCQMAMDEGMEEDDICLLRDRIMLRNTLVQ